MSFAFQYWKLVAHNYALTNLLSSFERIGDGRLMRTKRNTYVEAGEAVHYHVVDLMSLSKLKFLLY